MLVPCSFLRIWLYATSLSFILIYEIKIRCYEIRDILVFNLFYIKWRTNEGNVELKYFNNNVDMRHASSGTRRRNHSTHQYFYRIVYGTTSVLFNICYLIQIFAVIILSLLFKLFILVKYDTTFMFRV